MPKRYEGGYYLINADLIRTGVHQHSSALDTPMSDETLEALNHIQATPWRINRWLLDVMTEAYNSGLQVGDIPYHDSVDVPRKSDEEWDAMDDEAKANWKRELSDLHGVNARMEARRHSFIHKLDIARELSERTAIWFPHFVDFRGRLYPMCQDLHPQSDDIGRSLLEFAEGKPLGDVGRFWLGVRLANTFGQDKLSLAQRVQWVTDNEALIFDSADQPLDGRRFWTQADEPWNFLATCREFTEASRSHGFLSHLPVQVDGSCNGLQHLSAMGRDTVGARATNVADNAKRQDIYSEVAELVKATISTDAANGEPLAHQWVGRVDRKTVKRAVMTTPYGVTPRGISEQLVNDGHTRGMEARTEAAAYLRDKIVMALEQTIVSAKQIMAWIQCVADTLSKNGKPLVFETPTGNTIMQSYYRLNQTRVTTLVGKLVLWEEDRIGGLNDRKQTLAAAPNVIHAFDAAHLVKTVNRMAREIAGVSFSMIHDSYGCHACDVPAMSLILREEFVAIYEDNWLSRLEACFRDHSGIDIPSYVEFVALGDFDVHEVLRSEFFFA